MEDFDRGWFLGAVGGGIVGLCIVIGYIIIPVRFGQESASPAALQPYVQFVNSSLSYHTVVLVLPAFIMTLFGVLQAERWDLPQKQTRYKILSGLLGVPLLLITVIWLIYLIDYLIGEFFPIAESATIWDIVLVGFFGGGWTVIFSLVFLFILLVSITAGVGAGGLCGYGVARMITRE